MAALAGGAWKHDLQEGKPSGRLSRAEVPVLVVAQSCF
jgi:hypothetical protein